MCKHPYKRIPGTPPHIYHIPQLNYSYSKIRQQFPYHQKYLGYFKRNVLLPWYNLQHRKCWKLQMLVSFCFYIIILKTVTKMFKSYNLRSYLRNMHIFYEYFLSTIIFYALAIIRNSRNCEAKRKRIDQTYKDPKIPINWIIRQFQKSKGLLTTRKVLRRLNLVCSAYLTHIIVHWIDECCCISGIFDTLKVNWNWCDEAALRSIL